MDFEVFIHRDDRDRVSGMTFTGTVATIDTRSGTVDLFFDTESGMDWERVKRAVDAEEAVESADMTRACPICGTPLLPGETCEHCLRELRCDE